MTIQTTMTSTKGGDYPMQQQPILYAVIGFLAGALIMSLYTTTTTGSTRTMMEMMNRHMEEQLDENGDGDHEMGMDSSMDDMMKSMTGKTEADADTAFLEAMIVHHEGAIQMAEQIRTTTKRPELITLANDIIT